MPRVLLVVVLLSAAVSAQHRPADHVEICHRLGNGTYRVLEIDDDAIPRHLAHGDGFIYDEVPGMPGFIFGPVCELCPIH